MKKIIASLLFVISVKLLAIEEVELQLDKKNETKTKVKLPFPYRSLTEEEKNHRMDILPEYFYTILNGDSMALVGPLKPCSMIILNLNNESLVFHSHPLDNNVKNIIDITKNTFDKERLSEITGIIFTNDLDENLKNNEKIKLLYGNIIGISGVKYLKDAIVEAFGITNRKQIEENVFIDKGKKESLGEYEFAREYILVEMINNKIKISNTSPIKEDIISCIYKRHFPFDNLPDINKKESYDERAKDYKEHWERFKNNMIYLNFTEKDSIFYKNNKYLPFKKH